MVFVSTAGKTATCGHIQTGSSKVFINGTGACRVGIDTAGGIIGEEVSEGVYIGGSIKVFVEGFKLSLEGDVIVPHGGEPIHSGTTVAGQEKVSCV